MKPLFSAIALMFLTVSWQAADPAPAAKVHQVKLNGHTFTLPEGFDIELVAGPPLVNRPISADFDEQGRLYVSDSSGSNEKVSEQLKKKPHRIVRLEDIDGDGRFDKATVFADKMMFPEGTMWFDGSLYVAAPPSIWKLTDTDGDGVADQRCEWFKGKTLTGCANDLHGPYLGPDGWIYWCKGAFAEQTYRRPGRKPLVTRAAHVFRARPDGSEVEPVMTGGMDNPVDLVFSPGGERIFTTTFLVFPGGGLRDGLIHAVYRGVYGKTWNVLDNHPWTGPKVMPVLSHLGPAAPCGLTRYQSSAFGPDYRNNLFACLFNLRKVTRHILEPQGATFKSRDLDFLVSDKIDFHPTDVIEDADGSLLVVDTGGWYKLCCPTSQLVKPDVLGGIYRIRKKGAARPDDPRGLKLDWAKMAAKKLVNLLGDDRPVVRKRAIEALGKNPPGTVPLLLKVVRTAKSAEARRNAVWAASRITNAKPDPREVAMAAVGDSDLTVEQAGLHVLAVWRHRPALGALSQVLLFGSSASNRRVAAEALGRIGDHSAVDHILAALGKQEDRFLEHSLIFALIEIGDREGIAAGLKSRNPLIRRAALIALDQMDNGQLDPQEVVKALSDPALKETAQWLASKHPEWGGDLAGYLRNRLEAKGLSAAAGQELAQQLAHFAVNPAIQNLLADRLRDPAFPQNRHVVLRAMAQAHLKKVPGPWLVGLVDLLEKTKDKEILRDTVAAVRALPIPPDPKGKLTQALLRLAHNQAHPVGDRLQALAAVPGGMALVEPDIFAFLQNHLDRDQPVPLRTLAADVLARARLNSAQLVTLAGSLKSAGPMETNRLLDAFAQSTDNKVGQSLLAVLNAKTVRAGLTVGALKPRLAKFGPPVQKEAEKLYAVLDAGIVKQRARLEQLLGGVKEGDIRRGQAVFNNSKAACISCHSIGYVGGKVGPDLTRIGQIRTERDLLEAIVFPSASFVRGYEPVVIATRDGKVHNGLVKKEGPDEVVLAINAEQQIRIARSDIEDMQPSQVSVMPAGLDQQLTARDLADLVAFLKACK